MECPGVHDPRLFVPRPTHDPRLSQAGTFMPATATAGAYQTVLAGTRHFQKKHA